MRAVMNTYIQTVTVTIFLLVSESCLTQTQKLIESKVTATGKFEVDSSVVEVMENHRIYSNKYDKSGYYLRLNESLNISTIGGGLLRIVNEDNMTSDTIAIIIRILPNNCIKYTK